MVHFATALLRLVAPALEVHYLSALHMIQLLVIITARKQLNDLSDDMATKLSIIYYADAREALLKALGD